MKLPDIAAPDGIQKKVNMKFAGYNHTLAAMDGEVWDEENMTSDYYPLLSPRRPRYTIATLLKPNGLYAKDGIYTVDGTSFCRDGVPVGTVTDGLKTMTALGAWIIILPDKACYNTQSGSFGSLEAAWTGAVSIQDGSYAGQAAAANCIFAQGVNWGQYFRAGDAVSISGCVQHEENNTSLIIREISEGTLHFYENSFVINGNRETESAVTITRSMPELDFICENENRLWGCKGDTIYSSKLGDPFNWNVFDGLSTDSYAADVGSAGDFTGCISYLGYPVFFKEEDIYKVYGDRPSNFQVISSASMGVEAGSGRSLAIAGETLFYLSRNGVVAYTGGMPQRVGYAFGTERYSNAIAGSDGVKYYISMKDAKGQYQLFVYDTRVNQWSREDATQALGFGWDREMLILNADGQLLLNGDAREIPEGAVQEESVRSMVQFADFVETGVKRGVNRKGTAKLQMRVSLEEGATLRVQIQFDSDGIWRDVKELHPAKKRSYYLPIVPRRSDHFQIRLLGRGDWKLYSIVREHYAGSEL